MTTARVLVLLATYNGASWIAEQVDSILRQDGVSVDILVSDDGSTDGTVDLIRAYVGQGLPVRLLPGAAEAGSAARNFFRLMKSVPWSNGYDYIALSDQDDVWYPTKLKESIAKCSVTDGGPAVGLVSCAVDAVWQDGRKRTLTQSERHTEFDYFWEGAGQGCTFTLPAVAAAKIFEVICNLPAGILGKIHYHDWLIYAVCRRLGLRWKYVSAPQMMYRQHENNDTGARGSISALRFRFSKIMSGWYSEQVFSIALALNEVTQISDRERARLGLAGTLEFSERIPVRFFRAVSLLAFGRRKRSDSLVLACASIFGYLSHIP